MLKKICVLAVVAGMFLPVLGTAQEKKGKTPEERFAALDKNSDKKVSKEEYLAQYTDAEKKTKAETRFATADKDKDGNLTLDEFKTIAMGKKKA
jgi:Ca2+-binding EF-hand superfamily protein